MNISSEISSIHKSNYSDFLSNGTGAQSDFETISVMFFTSILLSFSINSFVIWLIVRGTGNGLVAEIFILNNSICEILLCADFLLMYLTFYFQIPWMLVAFSDGLIFTGRPLFQCLICVERYLAVIHPVTFLKYKPLRYRLICCTAAWVTCLASCIFNLMELFLSLLQLYCISYLVQFFLSLSIQLFCCVAVLRALKQSGPGERGRERGEENHMKRRAFHLILIITVITVIIYAPHIILSLVNTSTNQSMQMYIIQIFFLSLAGVVQPVLFLYRVGKLNFIKCQ